MTDAHSGPGMAYKSLSMLASNYGYKNQIAEGIDHIKHYSKEELEQNGITVGGKINALNLFNYINNHVAKPALKGKNLDSDDASYINNWLQVKTAVERYGHDIKVLTKKLNEIYSGTSTNYLGSKIPLLAGTVAPSESQPQIKTLLTITGQEYTLGKATDSIKDPTDAQGVAGEVANQLVRVVEEAGETGNLESLIAKAQGGGHAAHH